MKKMVSLALAAGIVLTGLVGCKPAGDNNPKPAPTTTSTVTFGEG